MGRLIKQRTLIVNELFFKWDNLKPRIEDQTKQPTRPAHNPEHGASSNYYVKVLQLIESL